jgi:hypothetical protein
MYMENYRQKLGKKTEEIKAQPPKEAPKEPVKPANTT